MVSAARAASARDSTPENSARAACARAPAQRAHENHPRDDTHSHPRAALQPVDLARPETPHKDQASTVILNASRDTHRSSLSVAAPLKGLASKPAVEDLLQRPGYPSAALPPPIAAGRFRMSMCALGIPKLSKRARRRDPALSRNRALCTVACVTASSRAKTATR